MAQRQSCKSFSQSAMNWFGSFVCAIWCNSNAAMTSSWSKSATSACKGPKNCSCILAQGKVTSRSILAFGAWNHVTLTLLVLGKSKQEWLSNWQVPNQWRQKECTLVVVPTIPMAMWLLCNFGKYAMMQSSMLDWSVILLNKSFNGGEVRANWSIILFVRLMVFSSDILLGAFLKIGSTSTTTTRD